MNKILKLIDDEIAWANKCSATIPKDSVIACLNGIKHRAEMEGEPKEWWFVCDEEKNRTTILPTMHSDEEPLERHRWYLDLL